MNPFDSFYTNEKLNEYSALLKSVSSLSRLFSESEVPFLHYRIAENIFCKVFNAVNLSRTDTAYDAKIGNIGIGIKTFIAESTNKSEKIAEFNEYSSDLKNTYEYELVKKISSLRNERISFANRLFGITNSKYHCITRRKNKLIIFDSDYSFIDIESIKIISSNDISLHFKDNINKYSYLFSKSTLFRSFIIPKNSFEIDINIITNPLDYLADCFKKFTEIDRTSKEKLDDLLGINYIFLPLYSTKKGEKYIPQKSGLNQWNAGGRKRDSGEIYIPIPIDVHKRFPSFFPSREKYFQLIVPTGEILIAKVCQDNGKALMTKPNKALAYWLLRQVFKLEESELLTYDKLKTFDVDSVLISKIDENNYKIDIAKSKSYSDIIY